MASKIDFNALRAQALGAGLEEEAVTVNTRALIDKVLARYSGEWTVLRELLQNAADASASKVTIKFETVPSSTVPVPQSTTPAALLQHTILHHTVKRLVVINNGQPFGQNDWSRLKRIAEGNPDETKIGAFGVGFYSVFSDCEEPFVSSGKEAMAFYWKGNSLFTRRLNLSDSQSNTDTTFVLDYRNTTSPIPSLLPLAQFLSSSLTFVGLSNIELWLDDWKVLALNKLTAPGYNVSIPRGLNAKSPEGLMKVNSVLHETAQLDATWLNIVGWKPKTANAEVSLKGAPSTQSLRTFFSKFAASSGNAAAATNAAREERAAQDLLSEDLMGECKRTVFLHVNTASISTSISKSFGQELERATKKPAPKATKIAVLTAHNDAELSRALADGASQLTDIFASVLPSRSGRVYIGFPTHQTTGLSAHISAPSVIPTVERESIDLNARWVRTWNQEMLRAAGIVCRIAWSAEIKSIQDNIARHMATAGTVKVRGQEVEKVLPEAIHLLNQFTFSESTPSSQVGNLIEEAFWTCNMTASIEILSSRGIMPSQNVRIATDELSFVEGIPVVPAPLFEKASSFVKRLVDYGIITEVTTGDIKKELEAKAISIKQMTEFLHWLSQKIRANEIDAVGIRSLLDGAVANDEEEGKVIVLGQIQHFINASKIPANMPVPENTLPFKYTKSVEKADLERIGWEELQIVPWLRFLIENVGGRGALTPDQDICQSSNFAGQVLPAISKQWDLLSATSKSSVIELLSNRTIMPTRMGMRKPSNAYFASVRLFDDLPTVATNAVKDKFLAALGVRKTIELELVFDRLLKSDASNSPAAWSHVDLIKYLSSVSNDIPKSDIAKLQKTAMCPAEGSSGSKGPRYRVSELYEPDGDLRSLGLRILHWPDNYRTNSEEGKFLRALGLRNHPAVGVLIEIAATASANMDPILRDKALRYLVDFQHKHNYSMQEIAKSTVAFLPLEGLEKSLALPHDCYTNEKAAIMGFDILRKDLHPHAAKLGVSANPPIDVCANWLVKNPPQSNRDARQLFDYFATRLNELNGRPLDLLSQSSIVPVPRKPQLSRTSTERPVLTRHLPPSMCFLGSGEKYVEIFDYVDFGTTANSFLLRCGSKHEPTTGELANLVVREPARIFSTFNNPEKYVDLMYTLARAWPNLKRDKDLVKEMRRSAFLLGFVEYPSEKSSSRPSKLVDIEGADFYDEEDATVKTYELAMAEQITIADDVINYNLFKGNILVAPPDEELENFYSALGALSLGNLVEEKPRIGHQLNDQNAAVQLQKLVRERIKLLFHDIPRDQIRRDAAWVEKNLSFVAVSSISVRKTLKGRNVSHTEATTAIPLNHPQLGMTIFFTANNRDLFNVSQALLYVCLNRPKPQQAIVLTTLLETDLTKLRARGYDVSRILRRRAAEARIAEEQRQKHLEEEQRRMEEAEAVRREHQATEKTISQQQALMPGVFPDSPDPPDRTPKNILSTSENSADARRPRGLFSTLSRSLGISSPEIPSSPVPQLPEFPAEVPSIATTKGPAQTPQISTSSPGHLQQNLLNAIKSSRAHNSSTLSSKPTVNDVKETHTFCDAKPGQNIGFFGEAAYGIKIFLANSLTDKSRFMAANSTALNSFAAIMLAVADSLHLSRQSLHLFYDEDSSTIAFNQDRALFFNYRYFETLHLANVQQGKTSEALVYWFVTACHELAHNLVADHSAAHSFYTESFVSQFFISIAAKIQGQQEQQAATRENSSDPPPSYS